MPNGVLDAICIKRRQEEVVGVATTNHGNKKKVTMTLMQAHEKLGHINEHSMKEISKVHGWVLADTKTLSCASCVAGKAKQKSLKTINLVEPNDGKNGYKAYLNLLMVKTNEKYPTPTNLNW